MLAAVSTINTFRTILTADMKKPATLGSNFDLSKLFLSILSSNFTSLKQTTMNMTATTILPSLDIHQSVSFWIYCPTILT